MPKTSDGSLFAGRSISSSTPEEGGTARTVLKPRSDPVVAEVDAWMAAHETRETLIRQWQDLEAALIDKATAMKISVDQAMRSRMAEARTMRALDKDISALRRTLDRDARRIVLMRATSARGALAKIRLGLRIQGPHNWNDGAVEALVEDGCRQLALCSTKREASGPLAAPRVCAS
jgi:hypothetical protein